MSGSSPERRGCIERTLIKIGPLAASVVAAIELYLQNHPGIAIGALCVGAGITGFFNHPKKR